MRKYNQLTLLVMVLTLGLVVSAQSKEHELEEDLRAVQGKFTILNHPSLGKTEGRNLQILLQRIDCKRCFVAVSSNSDGDYAVTLSKGKYRIIFRSPAETNGPYHDFLAPSQQRILDLRGDQRLTHFDIGILLPPE
jgi:hypothetical protein